MKERYQIKKIESGANLYRMNVIEENLKALDKDEYAIAKLTGAKEGIKTINLDKEELEILLAYYKGQEISIREWHE